MSHEDKKLEFYRQLDPKKKRVYREWDRQGLNGPEQVSITADQVLLSCLFYRAEKQSKLSLKRKTRMRLIRTRRKR
jgi:hypothetical protein